jgi:hypothetical protein
MDVEDKRYHHEIGDQGATVREIEADAIGRVGPIWRNFDRLAGNRHADDLAVFEQLSWRLIARLGKNFSGKPITFGKASDHLRMKNAELCKRSRHESAAGDSFPHGTPSVGVEEFMPPQLGPLIHPGGDAIGVMPVREENRCNPDLSADSLLEKLPLLRRDTGRVAGIDDDPTFRRIDGISGLLTANVIDALTISSTVCPGSGAPCGLTQSAG